MVTAIRIVEAISAEHKVATHRVFAPERSKVIAATVFAFRDFVFHVSI
jgi:hypothetical protein